VKEPNQQIRHIRRPHNSGFDPRFRLRPMWFQLSGARGRGRLRVLWLAPHQIAVSPWRERGGETGGWEAVVRYAMPGYQVVMPAESQHDGRP